MKDAIAIIHKCLISNDALLKMLGERTSKYRRIYGEPYAPHSEELNRITMQEIINDDDEFADDEPDVSYVIVKIDIWCKKNTCFAIAKEVKKTLKNVFRRCVVTLEEDLYEEDTKIYHKPIKVKLKIEQEDYYD